MVKWLAGCLFTGWMLVGCEDASKQASQALPVEPSATLATVEGTTITRAQLELAIERTLGDSAPLFASDEVERRIMQSLVSSRAMALLAERELSASEREQLELKAQAYREELLVRHHLENHASPEPVTTAMVSDYYERHPEEFGGAVEKRFEIIASTQKPSDKQRAELIALLSGPNAETSDWKSLVTKLRAAGLPVEYRHNRLKPELLEQPLRSLVEPTAVGVIAPLYTDGQLLLVRVLDEQQLPAKPLAEVSHAIREKLAPQALKKAVKELSAQALQAVDVQYSSQ